MANVMKRLAMAMSALFVVVSGLIVAWPRLADPFVISLLGVMLLWAGVEFWIGFSRPFEGITLSRPLVRVTRMMWPPFAVYAWLDFRYGWTRIDLPYPTSMAILIISLAGLALRVWAVVHLGNSFSYDLTRPRGKFLVQSGPYRLVRHPSYLGICILAALPGLILGSVPGFIGMTLATVIHTVFRLTAEEKILEEEFGETFRAYERKTYRLLPFIY